MYGFAIGANDAANSFGDWIGARIGKVRTGLILCSIFALIGALLEGWKVSKTIGGGIIPQEYVTVEVAVAALITAIIWVMIASLAGLPISSTHSIIGAVTGLGIALAAPVNLVGLKRIVICWLTTPTGAFVISFTIYSVFKLIMRTPRGKAVLFRLSRILITLTSGYVAYTWGANDVGNAVAVVSASGLLTSFQSCLVGGLGMAAGAILLGHMVATNVGFNITNITPLMGIAADLATAFTIHFFTKLRMPVSTSHAIVGAIMGVGVASRGFGSVNLRLIRDIVLTWVITPVLTGALAFAVFNVMKIFFGVF